MLCSTPAYRQSAVLPSWSCLSTALCSPKGCLEQLLATRSQCSAGILQVVYIIDAESSLNSQIPSFIYIYIYIKNLFIIVPFLSWDRFPHILSQRQHASASKGENGSLCSQMRGWVSARAHWSIKSHLQAVQLALVILTSATLAKERKHTSKLRDGNSMWMKHTQDSSSYSLEELQLSRCPWTFWFGRWCGACLCWRGYICSLQQASSTAVSWAPNSRPK